MAVCARSRNAGQQSPTRDMASQIAAIRASETQLPEDERIFYDLYAEFFLPDEMRAGLDDVDQVKAAISRYEQMIGEPFR